MNPRHVSLRPLVACIFFITALSAGCVTTGPRSMDGGPVDPGASTHSRPSHDRATPLPGSEGVEPTRIDAVGDITSNDDAAADSASTGESRSVDGSTLTNQERLDSAMEFYQASNDFWDQGDLDNAIGALDKAYSLILQVDADTDAELLQQKEDLRVTISRRIIEVYTSRFTVANGIHKAIPLVMNPEVEQALNLFKGRERKFFLEAYRRSGLYRPMIVKALQEAGLPEDLSWLPLIESGYKVRALSRARALGLWQFIASTGYKYGLSRDQWIDERMDPEKSTQAAIAYLRDLHQIFGEWTTALAGYNCGERRVLNRIKSQKIQYMDDFWDLYRQLPRETAFYVPKFLAVLHIVHNPEAHGFELPEVYSPKPADGVTVSKQIHLKTIAQHLDMDYELLREMNPELRQFLTPKSPYTLKVPQGKGEVLVAKLGDIPAYTYSPPATTSRIVHRVQRGDTLSKIARHYRTSVSAIMRMNGLKSQHHLNVGWRLKIPVRGGSAGGGVAAAYSGQGGMTQYQVRKGDSLWKIANRFSTTTRAIQSVNELRSTRLQVGQTLKVPAGSSADTPASVHTYRVKPGDSPYLIAKRHRMSLSDFLKVNRLTPASTIYPGQVVKVAVQ